MQRCAIDWDQGIVFFWSPKCGSTTLARFLAVRMGVNPREISGGIRPWMTRQGHIASFPVGYRLCTARDFRGVAVTRHPYTRLVSAYLDKFVTHRGKQLRSLNALEPFAQALYIDFAGRNDRSTTAYDGMSFSEFVAYLHDVGVTQQRIESLNPHWQPQAPVDTFELGNLYDDVVKFDRQPLEAALSEIYGEEITAEHVGRHNATKYAPRRPKAPADLAAVNSLELPAKFQPKNFHSAESAAKIHALYHQDFALFGYDHDPWE